MRSRATNKLDKACLGKRVHRVGFNLDAGGYQHLRIVLEDGTTLDCYENRQEGETALKLNGIQLDADEGEF